MLDVPAEPHRVPPATWQLPGIAIAQPGVGDFNLPTIPDRLLEDAVLVADAVAGGRNLERRQRVHETRGQPAESAVSQPRLELRLEDDIQIELQRRECVADILSKLEVEDV